MINHIHTFFLFFIFLTLLFFVRLEHSLLFFLFFFGFSLGKIHSHDSVQRKSITNFVISFLKLQVCYSIDYELSLLVISFARLCPICNPMREEHDKKKMGKNHKDVQLTVCNDLLLLLVFFFFFFSSLLIWYLCYF